ncbi:unnamed protein product [Microthlaspi erraticum]|uniref:Uncharacterized protein n=1 Tax=Microthlaspi erraticum TaxID=1685480 RepID=A0A6D2IYM5_9BRAS|nr:unnamed protein product [Microthlaspi erraticum]
MKDRESEGSLDNRIFVGGLSWDVTERQLEDAFDRYGKINECQIMVEKDIGRPRGFGFITFTDRRGADDAIKQMHGRELGGRVISVTKAEPKAGGDDVDKNGGYSPRGKGSYGGGGASEDECFKCGNPGHWARECPSTGGDRGRFRDPPAVRSRNGEFDGHRDRYGDREVERERDRYSDERRDGGREISRMKDRENEGTLDHRIFVGGLSCHITERQLEHTFDRYGKIIDCQIMVERDTGRPRGFGFITFTDRRGADDAIKRMHGRELGDRVISVNKAAPKAGGDDVDRSGGYSSSLGRGSYGGDSEDKCFKCGRPGHWARECPSAGGDQGRFRDPPGHRDRYGDGELEWDRYMDGRRRDRDRYETRDHYPMERYASPGDRYAMPHHLDNEYGGRERGYERDRYARGASDRYGVGPLRDEGRAYRSRSGPYDRPLSRA